jgi:hypothetical protein
VGSRRKISVQKGRKDVRHFEVIKFFSSVLESAILFPAFIGWYLNSTLPFIFFKEVNQVIDVLNVSRCIYNICMTCGNSRAFVMLNCYDSEIVHRHDYSVLDQGEVLNCGQQYEAGCQIYGVRCYTVHSWWSARERDGKMTENGESKTKLRFGSGRRQTTYLQTCWQWGAQCSCGTG